MNNSSDSLASLIFIGLVIAFITINFDAIIELFIFIAIIAIPCGILYGIINTIENYFKNRKSVLMLGKSETIVKDITNM